MLSHSFLRWAVVGLVVAASLVTGALIFGYEGYVMSWGGTLFKALSGAAIGWALSRHVVRLDLSRVSPELRPMAALSQAILIGAFAIAVSNGA